MKFMKNIKTVSFPTDKYSNTPYEVKQLSTSVLLRPFFA